jgi:hypothetical protein
MFSSGINSFVIDNDAIRFDLFDIIFGPFLKHGLIFESNGLIPEESHEVSHWEGQLFATDDAPIELVDLLVEAVVFYILRQN